MLSRPIEVAMMYEKPSYEELEKRLIELEKELQDKRAEITLLKNPFLSSEKDSLSISDGLEFLSSTAEEFFDLLPEQDIYHVIGNRLKEIVGDAIVIINSYDKKTNLFQVKFLKGLGRYAETTMNLMGKQPVGMTTEMNDSDAMEVLQTGKMRKGPDGLYELSFEAIPKGVCRAIEKLLNLGTIYVVGFAHRGELFGDVIIITRQGANEKAVAARCMIIETFINQAAVALQGRNAAGALQKSEHQYRLLAENATDIIWILNLSTLTFDYLSPSIERIRGFSPDEAQALSLEQQLSPESYQKAIDILNEELLIDNNEGIDKNRSRIIELEQSIKAGGYIWAEVIVSFIRDPNGNPTAVMGVTRDIEARKKAESVLIESEKKYRNLFENGSDLLCIHDLDGNLIETNISYKKEYGWTQEDLTDLNIRDIIPSRYQDKFDRYIGNILSKGSDEGYLTGITKSGEEVILEYRNTLIYDSDGIPKAVQGAARNVTKRFKAEKALRESEEKYKELVQYAPAGIYEFDMQKLRFISVNDVMCQYTGYTQKEFLGLDPFEILSDESKDAFNELVEDVFSNKPEELSTEYKIKGKNQREFWVLANARFFYEGGVPKRAMAVVNDLTDIRLAEEERRRLETQLQNAKKLESIGTLAGGVAHDLNNILSGIVSYPDLLLLDLDADSPLRAPLLAIKKSGERAAEIVEDLLTLARRGVGSRKVIDLNQVVNDILASPENNKLLLTYDDIRIETNLNQNILNIVGSKVHISKTLMNLVTNAVDAMPAGGKAMVATKSCYLDTAHNGYESIPEGEYTTLEISDMGIGISKSDLEHLFEPFYTKKAMGRSGTGLGMSVVWGTVKDHDGYIDIITEEGSGTTIVLYFPVSRSEIEVPESVYIEDYLGKGESLLIIDDSAEQRALAERMMQRLGYEVYTAASGEEAVLLVKKRRYDLLILDMIMPPGMDGLETYKQILEIVPYQKAIIASGYAKSERVHEMQQIGAGSYIKKPFTLEKIGLAARSELVQRNGGNN